MDKVMFLRGTQQKILVLQAGWGMETVHQLLSTLGPTTFSSPLSGQQRPPFTVCLRETQTCLREVFYSMCHDTSGRLLTAPRGRCQAEVSFSVRSPSLCIFPQLKSPRPGDGGGDRVQVWSVCATWTPSRASSQIPSSSKLMA